MLKNDRKNFALYIKLLSFLLFIVYTVMDGTVFMFGHVHFIICAELIKKWHNKSFLLAEIEKKY